MQDKVIYEYAVVRVVPRIEREEFVNIGLLLFCKSKRYLRFEYTLHTHKIQSLCPQFDIEQLEIHLQSFQCVANTPKPPMKDWDVSERFRWLSAMKSSSIQTSRPHPGFTTDLDATFEHLYNELVT